MFDVDRFISFEGNTGPYILYTIVRIKSILAKYRETTGAAVIPSALTAAVSDSEKDLQLQLARANDVIASACEEIAPHKLCQYIYEISNAFNKFYHETKILSEEDTARRDGWIALLALTKEVLETCIRLLGFSAPEKM